MTEEERQMFRKAAIEYLRDPDTVIDTKVQARIADELERLAALVAQSNAVPVAWQYRWRVNKNAEWTSWHELPEGWLNGRLPDYETRALYIAPHHPDVSAGLMEAAEIVERMTIGDGVYNHQISIGGRDIIKIIAGKLRSLVADRSGKWSTND